MTDAHDPPVATFNLQEAIMGSPLSDKELALTDAYWRAANYLSVGQIYLYDNPLLKKPLTKEHIKPRLLGHWGTTPGLNFIYAHLNRVITMHDLNMLYIAGPGHGGPGLVANGQGILAADETPRAREPRSPTCSRAELPAHRRRRSSCLEAGCPRCRCAGPTVPRRDPVARVRVRSAWCGFALLNRAEPPVASRLHR